jgi:hypothetical protein
MLLACCSIIQYTVGTSITLSHDDILCHVPYMSGISVLCSLKILHCLFLRDAFRHDCMWCGDKQNVQHKHIQMRACMWSELLIFFSPGIPTLFSRWHRRGKTANHQWRGITPWQVKDKPCTVNNDRVPCFIQM